MIIKQIFKLIAVKTYVSITFNLYLSAVNFTDDRRKKVRYSDVSNFNAVFMLILRKLNLLRL